MGYSPGCAQPYLLEQSFLPRDPDRLTHRQLEVLELIARGLTTPEIAAVLAIGLSNVKTLVAAVMEALGAASRTEAAVRLRELRVDPSGGATLPVPGFGDRPSVAVFPFDASQLPEADGVLAEGLLSDLTQRMGEIRWFPVIGREAASRRRLDGKARAAELGARYFVEGSLAREGERIAVVAELWDADRAELVWADRFTQPLSALASGESELIDRLLRELEPVIHQTEQVRAARGQAEQMVVWETCKRAEAALLRETAEQYRAAIGLFEKALAIDEASLHGCAGLALAEADGLYLGFAEDREAAAERARSAAERAEKIAPESFEAQFAMGRALAMAREDEAAVAHLERALEANPSSVATLSTVAGALRRTGANEAALPHYERALRLSPSGVVAHHLQGGLAMALFALERFEDALAFARSAVAGDPAEDETKALDFYGIVPASLALLGRQEEARAAWDARPKRRERIAHSARYVGPEGALLVQGLRRAGWDGKV